MMAIMVIAKTEREDPTNLTIGKTMAILKEETTGTPKGIITETTRAAATETLREGIAITGKVVETTTAPKDQEGTTKITEITMTVAKEDTITTDLLTLPTTDRIRMKAPEKTVW